MTLFPMFQSVKQRVGVETQSWKKHLIAEWPSELILKLIFKLIVLFYL